MESGFWVLVVFVAMALLAREIASIVTDRYGPKLGYPVLLGLLLFTGVLMMVVNVRLGVTEWANFLPPSWAAYLTSSGW